MKLPNNGDMVRVLVILDHGQQPGARQDVLGRFVGLVGTVIGVAKALPSRVHRDNGHGEGATMYQFGVRLHAPEHQDVEGLDAATLAACAAELDTEQEVPFFFADELEVLAHGAASGPLLPDPVA